MYFSMKSYLKSTRNHTIKHTFNMRTTSLVFKLSEGVSFLK